MSAPEYLKANCQHCGNTIEFPAEGAGQSTDCPHCGQPTTLTARPPFGEDSNLPAGRRPSLAWIVTALVIVTVAGILVALKALRPAHPSPGITAETNPSNPAASPGAPTNSPSSSPETKAPTATKSLDDFKIGAITFEKTSGSSLVYAVGILRNESDHQRFGVNLELKLTDARGGGAGTAKDYRAVIEPHQTWRFRALVLDSKATAASVARISEE